VTARQNAGRPIEAFDAMIAAIARSRAATVATRNIADFEGCGVPLLDPWEVSQGANPSSTISGRHSERPGVAKLTNPLGCVTPCLARVAERLWAGQPTRGSPMAHVDGRDDPLEDHVAEVGEAPGFFAELVAARHDRGRQAEQRLRG
jgi:hypothetical protein